MTVSLNQQIEEVIFRLSRDCAKGNQGMKGSLIEFHDERLRAVLVTLRDLKAEKAKEKAG